MRGLQACLPVDPVPDDDAPPTEALELNDIGIGHAATHALLREVIAELGALRADLNVGRTAVATNAAAAIELLQAIAATTSSRAFTVSELLEHAEVIAARLDPRLRDGIVAACGTVNGRRLGRLLRKVEGQDIGGLRVSRIDECSAGIVWMVSRVCSPL